MTIVLPTRLQRNETVLIMKMILFIQNLRKQKVSNEHKVDMDYYKKNITLILSF